MQERIAAPHSKGWNYGRPTHYDIDLFTRLINAERLETVDCVVCGRYLPTHTNLELRFCDRWLIELKYYWHYWTRKLHF